jgi:hypothetical protein
VCLSDVDIELNGRPLAFLGENMINNYFNTLTVSDDQQKRLAAVNAALEIAKASVGSSAGTDSISKTKYDLKNVAEGIEELADAIQAALGK